MFRFRTLTVLLVVLATIAPTSAPAATYPALPRTESQLLDLVNAVRHRHGLRALRFWSPLRAAAREQSRHILDTGVFEHGSSWEHRIRSHARARAVAEALAWGSGSYARPSKLVAMWLASPPHRAILLDPDLLRVGFGALRGTFMGYSGSVVVTADFATGD